MICMPHFGAPFVHSFKSLSIFSMVVVLELDTLKAGYWDISIRFLFFFCNFLAGAASESQRSEEVMRRVVSWAVFAVAAGLLAMVLAAVPVAGQRQVALLSALSSSVLDAASSSDIIVCVGMTLPHPCSGPLFVFPFLCLRRRQRVGFVGHLAFGRRPFFFFFFFFFFRL